MDREAAVSFYTDGSEGYVLSFLLQQNIMHEHCTLTMVEVAIEPYTCVKYACDPKFCV